MRQTVEVQHDALSSASGQIVVKPWSKTGQILVKHQALVKQAHVRHAVEVQHDALVVAAALARAVVPLSNTGQTPVKYWSNTGQNVLVKNVPSNGRVRPARRSPAAAGRNQPAEIGPKGGRNRFAGGSKPAQKPVHGRPAGRPAG